MKRKPIMAFVVRLFFLVLLFLCPIVLATYLHDKSLKQIKRYSKDYASPIADINLINSQQYTTKPVWYYHGNI